MLIKFCDITMLWSLCLLIFCLPFSKAAIEIFAGIAILAWIIKKVASYKLDISRYFISTELNGAIGLFITANILSVIASVNFALSLRGLFGKVFEFVMLYFVAVEVINEYKRLRHVMIAILVSAAFIIIDAGVQYFRGYDFLRSYKTEGFYLTASFMSHNEFGGWLAVVSLITVGLAFSNKTKHILSRPGLIILSILLFICLLLAYSRGAWIGIILGLAFFFYYLRINQPSFSRKKIAGLLAIACVIIFLVVPASMKERLVSIADAKEGSGLSRINIWQEALSIINDYPLFGSGLNTYSIIAPRYKMFEGGGIYPHNSLLHMAAETGVVGLVSFFYVIVTLFKLGIERLKLIKEPMLLGLLAAILAFLAHSFFDNHLYTLKLSILLWFTLSLAMANIRMNAPDTQRIIA
jgi:putative inorganic carbon (hco3(-)) transporter